MECVARAHNQQHGYSADADMKAACAQPQFGCCTTMRVFMSDAFEECTHRIGLSAYTGLHTWCKCSLWQSIVFMYLDQDPPAGKCTSGMKHKKCCCGGNSTAEQLSSPCNGVAHQLQSVYWSCLLAKQHSCPPPQAHPKSDQIDHLDMVQEWHS